MYVPKHFAAPDDAAIAALMAEFPLALLVTTGFDGRLLASHLPLYRGANGFLRGHLARANPQWSRTNAEAEALVMFQGPDYYVSPAWYPSKREHGRVVPTWNYRAVEVRGTVRFIEDKDWLRETVTCLTERHEQPRPDPWKVSDAPADYIEGLLGAIVGVEIDVASLEGKWKSSQNRSAEDRAGVEAGRRREKQKDPREEGPSELGAEDRT